MTGRVENLLAAGVNVTCAPVVSPTLPLDYPSFQPTIESIRSSSFTMATSLTKAGRLKPEARLGQAISEFQTGLSSIEMVSFDALQPP
jgi:hypothetical protein